MPITATASAAKVATRLHFALKVLVPNLSCCRSLRSCDIRFLYHERREGARPIFFGRSGRRGKPRLYGKLVFNPPLGGLRAARQSPGIAASAPRRPPSHPPTHRAETPPAEPRAAPPADAECASHHKASSNSGSDPVAQLVPTSHTQSIHHR